MKDLRSHKRTLGLCFISAALAVPIVATAGVGDIISLLTTITSTLKNSIGQGLSEIQAINTNVRNLEQEVVWPVGLINQTRTEVSQLRAQLASFAERIESVENSSASLVRSKQLEALLRGKQPGDLDRISSSYAEIYQPLPQAGQATPIQRNLMDADDAVALSALKTATVSDQASQQMLTVADGLEHQAALSAPGSASILTAQAQAATLQNQAMLHHLLAAELREEAAKLALMNALRKQSADANRDLRLNIQQILSRSR